MAITANGYIAKEDNTTSWVSETEWEGYKKMMKEVGNAIIGRKTFDVALREGDFPFEGCLNVVVTSKRIENKWGNDVVFVKSPQEALAMLADKGFASALVCGGGVLNADFMKENLIDEIYLDVEPIILGKGIKLFADVDFETKLELIGIKNLSENEVQLHYKVVK